MCVCVYVITLEAKTTTQFSYLSACTVTLNHLNSLSLMWDLLQMNAKPHTHTHTNETTSFGICECMAYVRVCFEIFLKQNKFASHFHRIYSIVTVMLCLMSHKLAKIALIWLIWLEQSIEWSFCVSVGLSWHAICCSNQHTLLMFYLMPTQCQQCQCLIYVSIIKYSFTFCTLWLSII